MKRVAFSVWPDYPGNSPRPDIVKVREESIKNMDGFFEDFLTVSEFEPFDKTSEVLFSAFKETPTKKDFINWSDYIRIVKLKEFLKKFDEVMYFDYDLLVFQPPKKYGLCLEGHFEGKDERIDSTYKFWFRGVNTIYYLSKDHLQYLDKHIQLVSDHIMSNGGRVKFTYPMNYIYPIEENVGYTDAFYNLGSMDDKTFCTPDKIKAFIQVAADFIGEEMYGLNGVNMMGSVKNSQEQNIKVYEEIRNELSSHPGEFDLEYLKGVIRNCSKPLRTNYNSKKVRDNMKQYLNQDISLGL